MSGSWVSNFFLVRECHLIDEHECPDQDDCGSNRAPHDRLEDRREQHEHHERQPEGSDDRLAGLEWQVCLFEGGLDHVGRTAIGCCGLCRPGCPAQESESPEDALGLLRLGERTESILDPAGGSRLAEEDDHQQEDRDGGSGGSEDQQHLGRPGISGLAGLGEGRARRQEDGCHGREEDDAPHRFANASGWNNSLGRLMP